MRRGPRTYGEIGDAFNALEAGQVEAVINDCPISKYASGRAPNLAVIQVLTTGENYGFPFQKDATDLREAVNGAIADMTDDGTYDQIVEKWVGLIPARASRATRVLPLHSDTETRLIRGAPGPAPLSRRYAHPGCGMCSASR